MAHLTFDLMTNFRDYGVTVIRNAADISTEVVLIMSQVSKDPWPHLSGLLTRNLTDGVTHWYKNTTQQAQPVLLGDSYNIRLPNVTCADSGRYICHLAAQVGDRNRDGEILLKLTGVEIKHLLTSGTTSRT